MLVGGLEHDFMTFHILGLSSSQLTNSIIFQRGRSTTNQTRWVYEISLALRYFLSTNYGDSTKKHRGFHGDDDREWGLSWATS